MKYRVEVCVDVCSRTMFYEVEARSAEEAQQIAEEDLGDEIREFIQGTVESAGFEVYSSAISEGQVVEQPGLHKDCWDFWGENLIPNKTPGG